MFLVIPSEMKSTFSGAYIPFLHRAASENIGFSTTVQFIIIFCVMVTFVNDR